ncbi:MAG: SDR family NAD(P)-dependent oxidoreductase [Fibrobacterota bacterium]|nr:SDR family NAD(P)-dependent oxidoreductase [Fibrobacterota bacterium]QQS07656.1 MAG: SDR family NAD(P)-dependent oxidoreductase [Fibrobacterota bacterium]
MKLALITGGSKGLGASLCRQWQERGFQVVEFSRSAPHPFSVQADLADPLAASRAIEAALQAIDPTSVEELVAVHNAGTLDPIGPVYRQDSEAIVSHLATNLTSGILFLSQVVACFQDRSCPKTLASISSGAALRPFQGWSLYCAAKAGLDHFVRTLAAEQKSQPHPFAAINIDPGVIDTSMQERIRQSDASDFPDVDRFIQRKEKGQLVPPDQVARSVLKILSRSDLVGGERYQTSEHP